MHAREPWGPIEARADRALVERLRAHGLGIPPDFADEFRGRLAADHVKRERSLIETTYLSVLRELLVDRGYSDLEDSAIRSALDALYAVTEENWELEDDALLTLRMLESAGYRLGVVSNAGDDKDVLLLVERFGLKPFFDFILTSAACSYRKPHPRIFELALAHWGYPASEVAMVGDTLEADILGANQAGLYSIWITRRIRASLRAPWKLLLFNFLYDLWIARGGRIPDSPVSLAPDARLQDLISIPTLLHSLA